jgi:capsular exopolysaccharide synthesis family protein
LPFDAPIAPPAVAARLDAQAIIKGLKRHWVVAMTLGAICSAAVFLLVLQYLPVPSYTARALLQVYSAEQTLIEKDIRLSLNDYRNFQKTQETLLKSNTVLESALSDANIKKLKTVKEHVPDQVAWLNESLKIDSEGEIMLVSLSGDRPEELAKIVNEVVDTYISKMVADAKMERGKEHEQLKNRLEERRARLKTLRGLRDNQQNTAGANAALVQRKHEQIIDELGQLRKESYFANNELKKAEIEFAMAQRQQGPTVDQGRLEQMIAEWVANDPQVAALESELAQLEEGKRVAAKNLNPRYVNRDPSIQITNDKIRRVRQDLAAAQEEARRSAEAQAQARAGGAAGGADLSEIEQRRAFYQTYAKHLEGEIKELEAKSQKVNQQGNELAASEDEIASLEDWIKRIDARVYTLDAELKAPDRIKLVEHAPVPKQKETKRKLMVAGGAAAGTLLLVLLGISFLEYRVRRIDSADVVAHGLGMRLIGALPATPSRPRFALPGRQGAALQEAYWRSRLNESVNAIRTLMLRQSQTDRMQVVMVTSASVGEGKTSLSCHLATSLARAGRKTLLLDCDLRNPTAHRVFDLPLEPGMCEVLRGQVPLEEISHPIALGDLRMITAGRCDLQALQALGTNEIGDVIARLRSQYDFIIVDTPPVLPVADPLLIGQHVDAALFSILRDVSRANKVHTACERLSSLGIRVLGAVVAGTPLETSGSEYYYTAAYVGAGAAPASVDDGSDGRETA